MNCIFLNIINIDYFINVQKKDKAADVRGKKELKLEKLDEELEELEEEDGR
jgi:hypothetical protein